MADNYISDIGSTTSDFSIIPEMNNLDMNIDFDMPMSASFFHSQHSEIAAPSNSSYHEVKFISVERTKGTNEESSPLSIIFTVSDEFVPNSSDRIALYPIGFSSAKDFLCYKWVPIPASGSSLELSRSESTPYTVLFEVENLPSASVSEFFQACYLMKNGKISGVSTPFQLKILQTTNEENNIENVAKKVLSIRIRELLKEKDQLEAQLCSSGLALKELQDENVNIEQLKMELLSKEEELTKLKLEIEDIKSKLTQVVLDAVKFKDELKESEEIKSVMIERQSVLLQDNEDLKLSLRMVKEELENAMKEKVASEKIASDLSEKLQATGHEFDNLAVVNAKLAKKVKKLRKVIMFMEGGSGSDWHYVDENMGGGKEGEMNLPPTLEMMSSTVTSSGNSTRSQGISESVCASLQLKMDEIASQLSHQMEEMKTIKREMTRKTNVGESQLRDVGVSTTSPTTQTESDGANILYGNSFLPATCTAPVFLPDGVAVNMQQSFPVDNRNQTPVVLPDSTEPSTPNLSQAVDSTSFDSNRDSVVNPTALPAPLQPVTTPSARQAAVLRHLSRLSGRLSTGSGSGDDAHSDRTLPIQDSDDDDYHSTGDSGERPTAPQITPGAEELGCPICSLSFEPSDMGLLNEHINIHLDRICPICSLAFSRTGTQETFEEHVHSHFSDEEALQQDTSFQDPSGPWDPTQPPSVFRLLEID